MSALNTVFRFRRFPIGNPFHPDKPPKTYSGTPVPQSFGDVAPRFDCDTAAKMDMAMRTIVRTRSLKATATINVQEYTPDSKGNVTPGALTTQTSAMTFLPFTTPGSSIYGRDELSSMAGLVTETLYDADGGALNGSGVYKVGTDNFSILDMSLLRRSDPADQRLPFIFTFLLNVGFPLQVYGQAVSPGGSSVGALAAHARYTIPPNWPA